ncbi:unnamed protein product [Chrysoparadoxa australica]
MNDSDSDISLLSDDEEDGGLGAISQTPSVPQLSQEEQAELDFSQAIASGSQVMSEEEVVQPLHSEQVEGSNFPEKTTEKTTRKRKRAAAPSPQKRKMNWDDIGATEYLPGLNFNKRLEDLRDLKPGDLVWHERMPARILSPEEVLIAECDRTLGPEEVLLEYLPYGDKEMYSVSKPVKRTGTKPYNHLCPEVQNKWSEKFTALQAKNPPCHLSKKKFRLVMKWAQCYLDKACTLEEQKRLAEEEARRQSQDQDDLEQQEKKGYRDEEQEEDDESSQLKAPGMHMGTCTHTLTAGSLISYQQGLSQVHDSRILEIYSEKRRREEGLQSRLKLDKNHVVEKDELVLLKIAHVKGEDHLVEDPHWFELKKYKLKAGKSSLFLHEDASIDKALLKAKAQTVKKFPQLAGMAL